jgi:hypothetical protein
VHAIIPRHDGVAYLQAQEALYQRFGIKEDECVYCGNPATDADHFFAIVKKGKPSGYFHTIGNVVPSCGRCNQSKGGSNWLTWMKGTGVNSPATRKVPDLDERVERLKKFEEGMAFDSAAALWALEDAIGKERWESYWNRLDEIRKLLRDAQEDAVSIRQLVEQKLKF